MAFLGDSALRPTIADLTQKSVRTTTSRIRRGFQIEGIRSDPATKSSISGTESTLLSSASAV